MESTGESYSTARANLNPPDRAKYLARLPRKRMAAGLLIRDDAGRVLVVEPTYKPNWELAGGVVQANESPRTGCGRRVNEELGVAVPVGRMLCIEWQGVEPDRSESLMFIYDGGVLVAPPAFILPEAELNSYRFIEPAGLDDLMAPRGARRVRAALIALEERRLVELEHGSLLPA
jgi:ADP-ribose pyrophosphatase YjhB (NUDIX family)